MEHRTLQNYVVRQYRRRNMSYKIVVDSCCDLTEELKSDSHFQIIPLTLQVGETYITDDEHFDQVPGAGAHITGMPQDSVSLPGGIPRRL